MDPREKLIWMLSLLMNPQNAFVPTTAADYLIANGVVVLPCNASVIEWHEVKTRPLDDEEKEYYAEAGIEPEYMFSCKVPKHDEEILVATKWGVDKDICVIDDCEVGLEGRGDWDGVYAWAEMPTYTKQKGGE